MSTWELSSLWASAEEEAEQCHEALWRILHKATQHRKENPVCDPNELQETLKELPELPSNKSAGPDGFPSQLLRALTFQNPAIQDVAILFTKLANTLGCCPLDKLVHGIMLWPFCCLRTLKHPPSTGNITDMPATEGLREMANDFHDFDAGRKHRRKPI